MTIIYIKYITLLFELLLLYKTVCDITLRYFLINWRVITTKFYSSMPFTIKYNIIDSGNYNDIFIKNNIRNNYIIIRLQGRRCMKLHYYSTLCVAHH